MSKTLRQWIIDGRDDPESAGKSIQPLLGLEVSREISSAGMDHDAYIAEYRKSGITARNVHCFVVLSDGRTVGLNENPSRGWTYPIGRYVELELRREPVIKGPK